MTDSGVLSILKDCLAYLKPYADERNIRIIALVARKELIGIDGIQYIEFPKSKKSWFRRLYHEYVHFNRLSKKIKPDVWLSLHDISPRVTVPRRFVYCHNPSPLFTPRGIEWRLNPRIGLFSLFYGWLYRFNIRSNTAMIVQQRWIADIFTKKYGAPEVWVAHPQVPEMASAKKIVLETGKIHCFYPAFPRTFKNFEVLGDAIELLQPEIRDGFVFHWTVSPGQNAYARELYKRYGHLSNIRFEGRMTREAVAGYYAACDVLLFPSLWETWGLPLTEVQRFGKKIFAADLPYAHETVGDYKSAWFFSPENPRELAALLEKLAAGNLPPVTENPQPAPDCATWDELFGRIFAR
jgi:glycosyltransferase involved in cell wall biosynthesis